MTFDDPSKFNLLFSLSTQKKYIVFSFMLTLEMVAWLYYLKMVTVIGSGSYQYARLD